MGVIWLGCALTLAGTVAAALLYPRLPDALPVHWNLEGHADGFLHKPWGVVFYPGMIGLATLFTLVLPAISPNGFRIEPFARAFDVVMAMFILFFAYMMAIVFAGALGFAVPLNRAVLAGIGVLFIGTGNVLGEVTKNFFVGIRTPWTLASDEVWLRTHRLAGWLFVLAGIALVVASVIGAGYVAAAVLFGAAIIVPIIYSFVVYRRLEAPNGNQQ